MAKPKSPNQAAIALEGVLAEWSELFSKQPASLAHSFNRGAKNTEIFWTEQQIGGALPSTVQSLLGWRDGERPASRLFDGLTREVFPELFSPAPPGDAPAFVQRPARFLNHRALAVFGTTEGQLKAKEAKAPTAKLVPFVWLPSETADEDAPYDEPSDGDRVLAIDSHQQAIWVFEIAGRTAHDLRLKAPSLANLLERYLAVVVSGRVKA